jgi:hypothetical protein
MKLPSVVDAEEDGDWNEVHMRAVARLRSCPRVWQVEEAEILLDDLKSRLGRRLGPWIEKVETSHHNLLTCSSKETIVQN